MNICAVTPQLQQRCRGAWPPTVTSTPQPKSPGPPPHRNLLRVLTGADSIQLPRHPRRRSSPRR